MALTFTEKVLNTAAVVGTFVVFVPFFLLTAVCIEAWHACNDIHDMWVKS